ncbi:MFS transporter [Actinokineospora terrae]|uniref:Predicted arabinose efflux permease, MFS family n=1 Tax=Actinokineospora terrae TaxID=155974 RepID=A0A1H9XL64_9PSEU|nr:MFS transporter [Actinokineospora terrae]SES46862.1 Predicted arabinose efflux permease, MFS family [Actinokineospora terrae]
MQQYRRMLGLPGVRALMVLMLFARIPLAATSMVFTLLVAVGLGGSYGAAGLVGAASLVGVAVGAPLMGHVVDRFGLRPMVLLATLCEGGFWLSARFMSYPVLLGTAFFGGLLALPTMSIARQAIAAMVPEELRRTAFSLDSISVELSYMVGPAVAVLLATQLSPQAATTALGCSVLVVGLLIVAFNPRVRADHERADTERIPRKEWLTPRFIGVLLVGGGAVFVLAGTDVTMVAALRESGQLDWTGLLVIVICTASAAGGLVHGAVRRSLPQVVLMGLMGLLTIPAAFFIGEWWLLALALVPSSALCAPTIATTGEEVARLAPVSMRGAATGLQSSAFTLGASLGAPTIGFVVDHTSPAWGFAVAGLGGVLIAAVAAAAGRSGRTGPPAPGDSAEAADGQHQAEVAKP